MSTVVNLSLDETLALQLSTHPERKNYKTTQSFVKALVKVALVATELNGLEPDDLRILDYVTKDFTKQLESMGYTPEEIDAKLRPYRLTQIMLLRAGREEINAKSR